MQNENKEIKKYKLLKYNPANTALFEAWLSKEAENGLFVKKVTGLYAVFVKGEAQKMRYLVTAGTKKDKDADEAELNKLGYEFVCACGDLNIYSSKNTMASLPDEKLLYKGVNGILIKKLLVYLIPFVIAGALIMLSIPKDFLLLEIIRAASAGVVVILAGAVVSFAWEIIELIPLLKRRRSLKKGFEKDNKPAEPNSPSLYGVLTLVRSLMLVSIVIICIVMRFNNKTTVIRTDELSRLPSYVSLKSLEQSEDIEYFDMSRTDTDKTEYNMADCIYDNGNSVFTLHDYTVFQIAAYPDNSKPSASQQTSYLFLKSPRLSEKVFAQLIVRYTRYKWYPSFFSADKLTDEEMYDTEEISSEYFDELYIAQSRSGKNVLLFARLGNRMVVCNYSGNADILDSEEAFYDALK